MRFLRLLRSVVVGLTLMLSVQTAARAQVNDLRIQRRLFELGGYIGMFFPASNHELLASGSSHKEFDTVAATLGGRLSFLPFYFFGAEVEGAITPTTTSNDKFAQIYHIRGHAFAQFPVWRTLCPFVLIGGGLLGVGSKASAVGSNLDLAFHWGAGAKYYIDDWLALRADFRQTISDGLGLKDANHFEFLGGLSFVFGWHHDRDGDGVDDGRDQCPDEAARTSNGCPPKDRDGDGIPDDSDACPDRAGLDSDGCPPEEQETHWLHREETKPEEAPKTSDLRQPTTRPSDVKAWLANIATTIAFATGQATLSKEAQTQLDKVGQLLQANPEIRIAVDGHTDNLGHRKANIRLSRQRAQAVKNYLAAVGVKVARITVKGFGPDKPIANNDTAEGRAKNRRIEIRPQ